MVTRLSASTKFLGAAGILLTPFQNGRLTLSKWKGFT
jgi:hypothetical protein